MFPSARPRPRLARALALAVLTGSVLLTPAPASSGWRDGSVDAADFVVWRTNFDRNVVFDCPGANELLDLRLRAKVAPDGTVEVHGVVRLRDEDDRRTLTADGGGQAGLADADGDGQAGLVFLAADFRDGKEKRSVRVELRPTAGQDIDASGAYHVALAVGACTATTEVDVRSVGQPNVN